MTGTEARKSDKRFVTTADAIARSAGFRVSVFAYGDAVPEGRRRG